MHVQDSVKHSKVYAVIQIVDIGIVTEDRNGNADTTFSNTGQMTLKGKYIPKTLSFDV